MTLVGKAVADAWGVPFEMKPWFADELLFWDGGPPTEESPFHDCAAGQYSDDTQMATALAQALVADQGYKVETAAKNYLAWYQSGKARGMGKATRTAMRNLDSGCSPLSSGVKDAQGNGTAMRALPLGLWYWRDTTCLKEVCELDARITHNSDEAVDSSYVVAALAAYTLALAHKQKTAVAKVSPELVSAIAGRLPCRTIKIEHALDRALLVVSECAGKVGVDPVKALVDLALELPGGVPETVGTAVAALLIGQNYREVVELSIRVGGDTDTRAAIAGGLASLSSPVPHDMQQYIQELEPLVALDSLLLAGR